VKKFLNNQTTPPGGFYYKQSESGFEFRHIVFGEIVKRVREHRAANGYDLSLGWADRVEDEMCASMPPGVCHHVEETPPDGPRSIKLADALNFLKSMAYWVTHGTGFVEQEEADRRARICVDGPFNQPSVGCTPCTKFVERIAAVVGDRATPYDVGLKGCSVCGCENKSQVWFPLDALQKSMTPELNAKFGDWCWKKRKE